MATTKTWNGTGDWNNNPSDWTPSGVPAATDNAEIASGTVTVSTATTINSILVDASTSATIAVNVNTPGITDNVTGNVTLGPSSTGTGVGYLNVDAGYPINSYPPGGTNLVIGGTLTVNQDEVFTVGNQELTGSTTVTAGALINDSSAYGVLSNNTTSYDSFLYGVSVIGNTAPASNGHATLDVLSQAGFGSPGDVTGTNQSHRKRADRICRGANQYHRRHARTQWPQCFPCR